MVLIYGMLHQNAQRKSPKEKNNYYFFYQYLLEEKTMKKSIKGKKLQ